MTQQKTLFLLLSVFLVSKSILAKPLLENAVDMDIDLEAEESQYVSHHVLKSPYLPLGYGGYSPYRNYQARFQDYDGNSSEEQDSDDGHHHHGHGGFGVFQYPHHGHFGFHQYRTPPPPPSPTVHKPLPKAKCNCKGPVLTTTTQKPTAKVQVTTTTAPRKPTKSPLRTTITTTQVPSTTPIIMASPRNPIEATTTVLPTTDELFLDIDLRFGGASK